MFGRRFLSISIWLMGSCVVSAMAMDCPVSDYEQVEKRVSDAPSCKISMQLLMACQLGSSGDVALSLIVIKKCEGEFLPSLNDTARRGYEGKVAACGDKFANESGTLFQSIKAICAAEVAHAYAGRAAKGKKR